MLKNDFGALYTQVDIMHSMFMTYLNVSVTIYEKSVRATCIRRSVIDYDLCAHEKST